MSSSSKQFPSSFQVNDPQIKDALNAQAKTAWVCFVAEVLKAALPAEQKDGIANQQDALHDLLVINNTLNGGIKDLLSMDFSKIQMSQLNRMTECVGGVFQYINDKEAKPNSATLKLAQCFVLYKEITLQVLGNFYDFDFLYKLTRTPKGLTILKARQLALSQQHILTEGIQISQAILAVISTKDSKATQNTARNLTKASSSSSSSSLTSFSSASSSSSSSLFSHKQANRLPSSSFSPFSCAFPDLSLQITASASSSSSSSSFSSRSVSLQSNNSSPNRGSGFLSQSSFLSSSSALPSSSSPQSGFPNVFLQPTVSESSSTFFASGFSSVPDLSLQSIASASSPSVSSGLSSLLGEVTETTIENWLTQAQTLTPSSPKKFN